MKKLKNVANTINILVSIMPGQKQMLNEIMDSGHYSSRSEAVRQCIRAHHKQLFPYYKQEREKKESEKDRISNMSAEDYCNNVIYGMPGEKDGERVCFLPPNGATAKLNIIKTFSEDEFKFVDPLLSLPVPFELAARQIPRMKREKEALQRLNAYEKGTEEYHKKLKEERKLVAEWLIEYDAERGPQSAPSIDQKDPFNLNK